MEWFLNRLPLQHVNMKSVIQIPPSKVQKKTVPVLHLCDRSTGAFPLPEFDPVEGHPIKEVVVGINWFFNKCRC